MPGTWVLSWVWPPNTAGGISDAGFPTERWLERQGNASQREGHTSKHGHGPSSIRCRVNMTAGAVILPYGREIPWGQHSQNFRLLAQRRGWSSSLHPSFENSFQFSHIGSLAIKNTVHTLSQLWLTEKSWWALTGLGSWSSQTWRWEYKLEGFLREDILATAVRILNALILKYISIVGNVTAALVTCGRRMCL